MKTCTLLLALIGLLHEEVGATALKPVTYIDTVGLIVTLKILWICP